MKKNQDVKSVVAAIMSDLKAEVDAGRGIEVPIGPCYLKKAAMAKKPEYHYHESHLRMYSDWMRTLATWAEGKKVPVVRLEERQGTTMEEFVTALLAD